MVGAIPGWKMFTIPSNVTGSFYVRGVVGTMHLAMCHHATERQQDRVELLRGICSFFRSAIFREWM